MGVAMMLGMIPDTIIFKCLRNLGADFHVCSLVRSAFYGGDPAGIHGIIAEARHIPSGEHAGMWEVIEYGEDTLDPSVNGPYSTREEALNAIASDTWAWARQA